MKSKSPSHDQTEARAAVRFMVFSLVVAVSMLSFAIVVGVYL
jgi:hypothetical protein